MYVNEYKRLKVLPSVIALPVGMRLRFQDQPKIVPHRRACRTLAGNLHGQFDHDFQGNRYARLLDLTQ